MAIVYVHLYYAHNSRGNVMPRLASSAGRGGNVEIRNNAGGGYFSLQSSANPDFLSIDLFLYRLPTFFERWRKVFV